MSLSVQASSCVQEIDYEMEGQNADRFRKNFADTPWIKVALLRSFGFSNMFLSAFSH
jgi:hypothetical protein